MKAVISGYGKMGHMIEGVLIKHGIEIAAITEDVKSIDPEIAKESVCIDFTTPDAFSANYEFLAHNFKAVVVGTTGWEKIKTEVVNCFYSANTPMIYSANFSIGVNAVFAAVDKVSEILRGYNYIPHIEEIHHTQKLDSPSGTAKLLAHIIKHELGVMPDITSIREGDTVGRHIVKFKSDVDKIKISHEAFSREAFAEGAVVAAQMTEDLKGVHEFKEMLAIK